MRAAKQIQLTSLCSSLLSEVTDVSFVPRKLIAHRHFVQRTRPVPCAKSGCLYRTPRNVSTGVGW